MQYGYVIKVFGKDFYREVQLPESVTSFSVGTGVDSDSRFRKELFFEEFELVFSNNNGKWSVSCTENIFLDTDTIEKKFSKELAHGDLFSVKYRNSENELFKIEFTYDFDNDVKDYTRVINLVGVEKASIGSEVNADIRLNGEYVAGTLVELNRLNTNSFSMNVRKPGFGVLFNGQKFDNNKTLCDGDFISIADCSLYFRNNSLYTSKSVVTVLKFQDLPVREGYPKFNRNTRIKVKFNDENIEILSPDSPPAKPSGNILMQLFPAIAMILLTIIVRGFLGNNSNSSFIIFSVCSMSLGIITSIVSMVSERKKYKKEVVSRIENYNAYINRKRKQIAALRAEELYKLNRMYISSNDEIYNIRSFSGNIFDKTVDDDDFLCVRIGTGTIWARRKIEYKKMETYEAEDELVSLPEKVSEDFRFVSGAPVVLDLVENSVVGIVGSPNDCNDFVKSIVLDIVSRHYFRDVKVFFLLSETDVAKYEKWIKWLPHITDQRSGIRNIIFNSESKNLLFERLYVEFGKRLNNEGRDSAHYVVFVLNEFGIKTHPVSQYISMANECGASFLFFEEKKESLPLWCSRIIRLDGNRLGRMIDTTDGDTEQSFEYSFLTDDQMEIAAKLLSPIYCEEISLENALTKSITLFEMLNIFGVEDIDLRNNWAKSEIYKTMAAPLGVKTKNEKVYLDLHEKAHGPHGLVAGTTGSGKSEILQTYILTMAIYYHPYEVGFVIIDFKGGGMANQFKNLPHMMGAITNIDGKEINRSLMSIKAELEKRQRVFAEYNVNNISNYIKLYKEGKTQIPIPHLIIIVDEFAELKAEQPDFMRELISAARIGRSLGVHLILATQKPAGQVSEQIWSNSKFKLCLKVQTKEDSNEVLKSPLAAEIKEPGRAYLQVGNNEIFELFQSAYSGASSSGGDASSEKEFVISEVDLMGKRKVVFKSGVSKQSGESITQLEALVDYVKAYCENENISRLPSICLAPLIDLVEYKKNKVSTNPFEIPIGIYDDPNRQLQDVACLNVAAGNTVIIGSSQYGKTNLLQLIIRSLADDYTPDEVNIYVLDFGSMALRSFEKLNHVGGVATPDEDERIKNLFRLLMKEVKNRKEKYAKLGITSFNSYVEAGYSDLPRVMLLVDNFIAFKELYPAYEDDFLSLCREGVALGISIVITSLQMNGITYKYLSNFSNKICLYCNSRDEYGSLFDRCRIEPKSTPGRGLIMLDKEMFELQTYLAFSGEREIERVEAIRSFVKQTNLRCENSFAKSIPCVPNSLDISYVNANVKDLLPYHIVAGIDYDTIDFQILDLSRIVTLGISGREKSGKKNLVKLIMNYCQNEVFDHPSRIYILDDYSRRLKQFSSMGVVEKYSIDISSFEETLTEIETELATRKERMVEEGIACLDKEPLIICIVDNQSIFDNGVITKQVSDAYKRIVSSYKMQKVLFVFSNVPNVNIAFSAPEMLKQMKELSVLFIMEDITNIKLFDFNMNIVKQHKKQIEIGDAFRLNADGTLLRVKTVKAE